MRRISTLWCDVTVLLRPREVSLKITVMRRISTVLTSFWHAIFFGNPGHAEDLHTFLPILVMRRISTLLTPFGQILQIPVMRRISTLFSKSPSCGGSPHFFKSWSCGGSPHYLPPSGRFCKSRSCGGSPHFEISLFRHPLLIGEMT